MAVYGLVSSLWLRRVASIHKPGPARLLTCIPLIVCNTLTPLAFDHRNEVVAAACMFVSFVWLGTFKIAGFAFERGPLVQRLTFAQFQAVLNFPFTLQASGMGARTLANSQLCKDGGKHRSLLLTFAVKGTLLALFVHLIPLFRTQRIIMELLYAFALFFFLGVLMDSTASLASGMLGVQIAQHFNQPYLACSLTDWWSRRWNLTVGYCLRFLCYDPVVEGRLIPDGAVTADRPSKFRRFLGTQLAFFVSGAMHELALWYLTGRMTGHWLLFFSMQAPLLAVESELRREMKRRGWHVPIWAAVPLTLSFLLLLADWLFFPPCFITKLDMRVTDSIRESLQITLHSLHVL